FSGADPAECSLLGGAVQDLNLMLRGAPQSGRSGLMRRLAGTTRAEIDCAATVAIYNLAAPAVLRVTGESFTLPGAALAWRTLPAGTRVDIEADSGVWMQW
ncbi:MAG TPA: HutD family protein, partial [Xanthomonadales bacterium]|nr:HutD family protein [Xanthomonadales bacterium]